MIQILLDKSGDFVTLGMVKLGGCSYWIFVVFIFGFQLGFGQKNNLAGAVNKDLIQLSGMIVESDSLKGMPFATVMVKHTQHGTIADYRGYFSFVAEKGDTLLFSELGYLRAAYVIPDTLSTNRYALIQLLHKDTIQLKTVNIYPWPTVEKVKEFILAMHPVEDDLDRARKNLTYNNMREVASNVSMDGSLNYKYAIDQRSTQLYSAGQYPTFNLFNPIAWSQFIEAWKRGDFRN